MKSREKEALKIRLDDIVFDFKNVNKSRAFERLVDVVKTLIDEVDNTRI